jgi:uncharacterized protein
MIKCIASFRYAIDLAITRMILKWQHEPRYNLKGSCNGCGQCCETPMVQVFPLLYRLRDIRGLLLAWNRLVNGFKFLKYDRKNRVLVFECTHLNIATRRCDCYSSRPGMCRDYPRNLTYSVNPSFLPGCGHYAVAKNADSFRKTLETLPLPKDKLETLMTKLHLKDDPRPIDRSNEKEWLNNHEECTRDTMNEKN